MPKLRAENESLRHENAILKRDKSETDVRVNESIQELQMQMMNAVTMAVEKASKLQKELESRNIRVKELEKQLADLRKSGQSDDARKD
jgi:predicted RNase H-like nuclease (RuvC/YqgF family)